MSELETFKTSINLVDFAAAHGFTEIDRRKSSSACTILRRDSDKIGISRDNKSNHWIYFDIRNNRGGTIIDFLQAETGYSLGNIRKSLRNWLGTTVKYKADFTDNHRKPLVSEPDRLRVLAEFDKCETIGDIHSFLESRNIKAWTYLSHKFLNSLFVDCHQNIVFPHYDQEGLCGLEKRNTEFWGFSKKGKKGLWFSRATEKDEKFIIGESGIDMLSYYQIKDDGCSRYFSLCGNLSDDLQINLLKRLVEKNPSIDFVLAFDNDEGGQKMIEKIKSAIPEQQFIIDLPPMIDCDWNNMLQKN